MKAYTNEKKIRKRETFKRLINLGLIGICIALEVAVFGYHWWNTFRFSLVEGLQNLWSRGNIAEVGLYTAVILFFSATYGSIRLGYQKNAEIVFSQVLSTLLANIIIYLELSIMSRRLLTPEIFIFMMVQQTALVIVYINIANRIYKRLFPPRKLLLIHGDRPIDEICSKFESRKDKYIITGCVHVKEGFRALCNKITAAYESDECNAVVLGDISVEERGPLLKFCYERSIRVYLIPKITDVILMGAEELHVFDSPILLTREYSLTMEQRFLKRLTDIVCALLLLILASPFMLITAIAIKLYDGGPVLYKQVRCTMNRREFKILKFRSMRTDAEKDGVARLARKNDSRITPVGKFIRKCRIDELPQLLNILKGDMSFVGPRPERPEIIDQYLEVMPEFVFRMKVKAGLAGFAQVYGKYNTSPYDKLKLDLTYIENYSTWLDLKLMMLTLKILFWPDSTEGVEAEQITALREEKQRQAEASSEETR
ncbi:MAG: sugar transferase [Butyrivibrio sp.]|nr:sugar transferase [Acetatifactor muris]MCM1559190.1 sugar transferase [Butyrivibrio sp.]